MSFLTGCIIGTLVIFLVLNVVSVFISRKRGMDAPQDRLSKWCFLVIMPTIILLYGVWFVVTFIPSNFSREARDNKKKRRARLAAESGLTDDEINFRGGRLTFNELIKRFEFEKGILNPKAPEWDAALRQDELPEGANQLLETAIDASTLLAYIQMSPVASKENLSLEQNSLDICFEDVKAVLMEHVHMDNDHAEDFIVHELDKAMEADNTYRTDPLHLPNLACAHFGIVDENYEQSQKSSEN